MHLKRLLFLSAVCAEVSLLLGADAGGAGSTRARELTALAQAGGELAERARALQQLALIGTAESVPVLASLLGDPHLGHYARDALEQLPDPAAGEALLAALDRVQGRTLIGIMASLGVRREPAAVPALGRKAAGPDDAVAVAALVALGRIGTDEALRLLTAALATDSAPRRAAAAEGLVALAERRVGEGRLEEARALYAQVRAAEVPALWHVAATRGLILHSGPEALPLLVAQLRTGTPELREMALGVARELRGAPTVTALVAELENLAPAWQAAVLETLVALGDARALGALEAKAKSAVEDVRVVALRALGAMGQESSLPLLLAAVQPPTSEAVSAAAYASLTRLRGTGVDAAIVRALAAMPGAVRVRLIGVLGDRRAEGATGELMALARGSDQELAKAAFRALGMVANPAELPRLIALAIAVADEETKALADRAVVTTAMKVLEPERRAEAVVQAFLAAPEPATKAALLRPLGAILRTMGGNHEIYFVVRAALQDPAEIVRTAALRCLAEWPDATPTQALLDVASQREVGAAAREMALRGAIRMAGNVAAGRERSPLNVLAAFAQANGAARTATEKMMVVAGLGSVRRWEAVQWLQPHLDDPEVAGAAALAIVQVAAALPGPKNAAALQGVLTRIATTEKDEEVRRRAERLAQGRAAEPKAKAGKAGASVPPAPGQLFNGRDLGNWDGDPGVWRVRDGAIVGGTLCGNPRNEFLATTRPYRDFVLRLEYRLVGHEGFVNGGVQFRSVRVSQPPNEMSGYQADIGAGHSGSLYDESRRKKFLARAPDEQVQRLEKVGEWNRYEIRCVGATVELTLNGERTVAYTETDPTVAAGGLIALQIHGNCRAEIAFRNLTIEEL